jgi:hypothetical protein
MRKAPRRVTEIPLDQQVAILNGKIKGMKKEINNLKGKIDVSKGKVLMGKKYSEPKKYNFPVATLDVRAAQNFSSGSPAYVARFSNAGGSGSGVIIQAGYDHKDRGFRKQTLKKQAKLEARNVEVLRLASFDGPPKFIFYNNGRLFDISDKKLKRSINPLMDVLEKITNINGVTYQWKNSDGTHIGLIAQEVERVFPELVQEVDGYKGIDYVRFTAVLVEGVKELREQVVDLSKLNKALHERVTALDRKQDL